MSFSYNDFMHIFKEYGSSFYILNSCNFCNLYDDMVGDFRKFYLNTNIAYSYKTNYIPKLCKLVNDKKGYAEVVSDMEYDLAKKIGVHPRNVFYNGPFKDSAAVEHILLNGGVVNLDSDIDISIVGRISKRHPNSILRVGIRCNFDVGDGVISRFGFDVHDKGLASICRSLEGMQNVNVVGLHYHFASRSLDTSRNAMIGMLELLQNFTGLDSLTFISAGGGFYGPMSPMLAKQLNTYIPNFKEYASVIAKPFSEFFSGTQEPELIIEPGTALAADSVQFVARVESIKEVRGKPIATLSGSAFNTNPTFNNINLPIIVYHCPENCSSKEYVNLDMAGYTCIEKDYLYRNYNGPLSVGDFVLFTAAGSYSVVMKPPFILPNVPIVELEDGSVRIIKRQETFEDVFCTYNMDLRA